MPRGVGIQPQDPDGYGRRQRDWARDCAEASEARRACVCCGSRREASEQDGGEEAAAISSKSSVSLASVDITQSPKAFGCAYNETCCASAASMDYQYGRDLPGARSRRQDSRRTCGCAPSTSTSPAIICWRTKRGRIFRPARSAGVDCADQFGKCGCAEARQRGLRCEQERSESTGSRTRHRDVAVVRVNGIAPATVVAGSTMFPRDRVMSRLSKYEIPFSEEETNGGVAYQARAVLCKTDLDKRTDSAGRLRGGHHLPGGRRQRQNDRPRDSGGRRAARKHFCGELSS